MNGTAHWLYCNNDRSSSGMLTSMGKHFSYILGI